MLSPRRPEDDRGRSGWGAASTRAAILPEPLAVALFGIDRFKRINECFGYLMGDLALREVGILMSEHAPDDAIVSRYSGDSFAIMLKGAEPEAVMKAAETIIESVKKTGRLLIVDEAFGPYGIGAEIAAQVGDLAFDYLDAPIRRLNGVHTPTPYSPPLEAAVTLNPAGIERAIRDLLAE